MERSIHSAYQVFLHAHKRHNTLKPTQVAILKDWYQIAKQNLNTKVDLIIYIRTKPELAMERLQSRGRPEEKNISTDYLKSIHELYDLWLGFDAAAPVITLDGSRSSSQILHELNTKLKIFNQQKK